MQLSELEDVMVVGQLVWFVSFHYIHRDELWKEEEYLDFADYARRRWGVTSRSAYHWASYGEILLVLEPSLSLEAATGEELAVNSPPDELQVHRLPGLGPALKIAPTNLRPLIALRRIGFPDEDLREIWNGIIEHTIDPSAKLVKEEVIHAKKESLQGGRSPKGAEALRQMIAQGVYDLVRHESESDEIAVRCRDAVTRELWDIAADSEETREQP